MELVQEVLGFWYVIPPRDYVFSIVYDVIVTTDKVRCCFKDLHITTKENVSEKVMTWHCCRAADIKIQEASGILLLLTTASLSGFFFTVTQVRLWFDAILSFTSCVAICLCFLMDFGTDLLS